MSPPRPESEVLIQRLSKGERTRLRLLEGAIEAFAELGFEGASITEICKTARIHRTLLLHYFASKEALMLEALDFAVANGRALITRLHQSKAIVAEHPVELYVRGNFAWYRELPRHASFIQLSMQKASYDPKVQARIREIFTQSKLGIEAMISSGIQAGLYAVPDRATVPDLAARVHELVLGALLSTVIFPGTDVECESRCLRSASSMLSLRSGP